MIELVLKAFQAKLTLLPQHELEKRRFAIAFSGGVDSSVLLHAAVTCLGAHRCVALHVHHGLNVHADSWQEAAQAVAQRLGVQFEARRVVIDASGQGIEAAAREARYAALSALCIQNDASVLLLGHHEDDQVETMWLQLLRGGGLPGVAAMPEKPVERIESHAGFVENKALRPSKASSTPTITWLRPLLSVPRSAIQAYAAHHHLSWIEDDSNVDVRYARNALRHDILPQVAKHFPAYKKASVRFARYAAQTQSLLDDLAEIDLRALESEPHSVGNAHTLRMLSHNAFNALLHRSFARAVNVLRYWMRIEEVPVASSAWLDEACRQLDKNRLLPSPSLHSTHAAAPKRVAWQIPYANFYLSIYRDRMYWERADEQALRDPGVVSEEMLLQWQGQTQWLLTPWGGSVHFIMASKNETASVSTALLRSKPLTARKRSGGERFRAYPGAPSRTLKNLFQEANVPAWQRALPLIYIGETLLFVPYIGLNLGDIAAAESEISTQSEDYVQLEWCVEPL